MIKYYCSDGTRVTEATIKKRVSAMYRDFYTGSEVCEGCGGRAQGSAHIIPKARLKVLHKTELIWSRDMVFPACYKCNMIAENPTEVHKLMNHKRILEVTSKYDHERYTKML